MGVERERLAFTRVKQICTNLTKKAKREYFKKTSKKKKRFSKGKYQEVNISSSFIILTLYLHFAKT